MMIFAFLSFFLVSLIVADSGNPYVYLSQKEKGQLEFQGKIFRQVGTNSVDLFWKQQDYSCEPRNNTHPWQGTLDFIKNTLPTPDSEPGIFIRFAASPFWPIQFDQTFMGNSTQQEIFWQSLDDLFDLSEKKGLMLIPSILWNEFVWGDYYGEDIGATIKGTGNGAKLMEQYITMFVQRYKNRKNILAWEIGNEHNLWADRYIETDWQINTDCHSPPFRGDGKTIFYTSDDLHWHTERLGSLIQSLDDFDPNGYRRLVSSGWSIPVKCSWHNYKEYPNSCDEEGPISQQDNAEQLKEMMTKWHPKEAIDIMSAHMYAHNEHNIRLNYTERWGAGAMEFMQQIANSNDQAFFLGEFGNPDPSTQIPENPLLYNYNVLKEQLKTRIPLSSVWVIECDFRCMITSTFSISSEPRFKDFLATVVETNKELAMLD